jgi:hypothetical protein
MNVGSIGAFAGGLAGGYQTERKARRDDKLADAEIGYRGAQTKLAGIQADSASADMDFIRDLGAELRANGLPNLGASIDGGPADPKDYAQWMLTRRPQRQQPGLTQPRGGFGFGGRPTLRDFDPGIFPAE